MFKLNRQDTYGSIILKIPIQLSPLCPVKSMLCGHPACSDSRCKHLYCGINDIPKLSSGHGEGMGLLSVRARTTPHTASPSHTQTSLTGEVWVPGDLSPGFWTLSCETEHLKALSNLRKRDPSHPEPLLNEISIPVSSITRKSSCSMQGNIFCFPSSMC